MHQNEKEYHKIFQSETVCEENKENFKVQFY